ncbi:MAG: hypothetical protein NTV94_16135 [Planctomycetota bacterium]|nr:hypothetical protein [Planctomycetota bacterium]
MRSPALALAAFCTLILPACTLSGKSGTAAPTTGKPSSELLANAEPDPFRPTALRIHPLTHVDAASGTKEDRCAIILHFELKDRFGDAVKAPGLLRIELAKPAQGALAGMESRELTWELTEFINAEENFKRFDVPTRTYRIALNAPAWVCEVVSKKTSRDSSVKWLKIRASIELPGTGQVLRDEYVIQ